MQNIKASLFITTITGAKKTLELEKDGSLPPFDVKVYAEGWAEDVQVSVHLTVPHSEVSDIFIGEKLSVLLSLE